MSKDAARQDETDGGVVDLSNDARWKARLEEARARRAEALKSKGGDAARIRRKPWEEDAGQNAAPAPPPRETGEGRLEFSDRVDTLREQVMPRRPTAPDRGDRTPRPPAGPVRGRNWRDDDDFSDDLGEILAASPAPPDAIPPEPAAPASPALGFEPDAIFSEGAMRDPAPARSRGGTPRLVDPLPEEELRPYRPRWIPDKEEPVTATAPAPARAANGAAPARRSRGDMPMILGFLLLLLAATPFADRLPPMVLGPAAAPTPALPAAALGITTPFAVLPEVLAGYVPPSLAAPERPRAERPAAPPAMMRDGPEPFPPPASPAAPPAVRPPGGNDLAALTRPAALPRPELFAPEFAPMARAALVRPPVRPD